MTPQERADFLIGDYNMVTGLCQENTPSVLDREAVDRFFYTGEEAEIPLVNKDGAVYMQQLVNYITGTLFPSSGEWINIDNAGVTNKELLAQISNVEKALANHISSSNFYHRMTEAVYNSLLYNKAIVEPVGTNGLSFLVHDHETLAVSDLTDGYSNRAYSEKQMTIEEVKTLYKNVPKSIADMRSTEDAAAEVTVIKGIVPNREPYVPAGTVPKRYKFATVAIVQSDESSGMLTPINVAPGYETFPVISFQPYGKQSLAELALPAAELANKYAKAMIERADIVNHPPISISLETELRNSYNLTAGGLVPVAQGEEAPAPIQTAVDLNVSEKTIAQQQQILRNIFKVDYIMRSQITNLSQFEYNQSRYNALAAIEPLVADMANKALPTVLMRTHNILKRIDKNYKKVATNLEPTFIFTHLNRQMAEAKKLAKLGHLGQLITPFAQMNPQAMLALDVEVALTEAAKLSGHPELIRSERDKQEILQALVEQQQQLQQQELDTERMKAEGGEGEQNA